MMMIVRAVVAILTLAPITAGWGSASWVGGRANAPAWLRNPLTYLIGAGTGLASANEQSGTVCSAAAATLETGECLDLTTILGADNAALLTESQRSLVGSLLGLDQQHLFEEWPPAGQADAEKKHLMAQLESLDGSYPGGLSAYISKARELLEASARGDNPFEGFVPSVPSGEELFYGDEEYQAMEAMGMDAICRTGFVLVAGGLGERLGFSGIKLALPVESCSEDSFLKMYADWILSLQSRCRATTGDDSIQLPLAIMTSGDTDAKTRELLEAENFFGLEPDQVSIMMQDKVPALSDSLGRLSLAKGDRWTVETKPHGHGDVHHLLHRTGLAQQWAANGKEWAFFFQDTNPLVIHALVPMLGVSVDRNYDMNSLCVPRKAGEAAGAITKLTRSSTGESLTINVEYNQLDPLLRSTPGYEGGDVDDPETNYSPFPGNVNNLLVKLDSYAKVVGGPDQGVVEEFVNPKYKDDTRTTFKKPTRLECMMQDLPKLLSKELGDDANVGFTTMERWLTFSPAKNAPSAGADAAKKGSPPGTPSSAEADFYQAYLRNLETSSKVTVETGPTTEMLGVPVTLSPAVVLKPSFAATSKELETKFQGGSISRRSALVVEGEGVEIADLTLDGALVIKAAPGVKLAVKGLKVSNAGWSFSPLTEEEAKTVPEELQIRGYKVERTETLEIVVSEPGSYVVDADGTVSPA